MLSYEICDELCFVGFFETLTQGRQMFRVKSIESEGQNLWDTLLERI